MRSIVAGLLLAAASPCAASAQMAPNADPYTDLSQYLLTSAPPQLQASGSTVGSIPSEGGNVASSVQFGSANTATLNQTGIGNFASVIQLGNGNGSSLTAQGSNNLLVSNQVGDSNAATIAVYGSGNQISDTQIGSNLSFGLQQVGNGKSVSVVQIRR